VNAYQKKDRPACRTAAARLLQLIRDMDELAATRQEFLLGRWIAEARAWGANDEERKLNEWNARNILTLWGPKDSSLKDYANRQWSGLLADFYLPRWKMFFERLDTALAEGQAFDAKRFEQDVRTWEEQWTHRTDAYPTAPRGDSVAVAKKLWARYRPVP
jgi:alpha-N-acetylglucosaminidase